MDQQPQLRVAKRSRIRGCALNSEDWHIVEPRCGVVGIHDSRRADGGEVQINIDVFVDRRSRCEAQMSGCEHSIDVAIQSRQSNVRNARYGYRGVRVGEASHPGPSHHSSAPDDVWDSLELTLQRIESDTDNEPLVRPFNRNVAQRISIEDAPSRVPIIATEEDE